MQEAILRFIKKAVWRIGFQRQIETLLKGLTISLCVCLGLLLVSLLMTISYTLEKCLIIVGVGIIAAVIYGVIRRPKSQEVALLIDQTGLQERVSTALMLLDSETPISKLQREDTLLHIKDYNLKAHFPMRLSLKRIGCNALLIVICLIVFMIPTKAKQEAHHIRSFNEEKGKIVKEIEKQKELINEIDAFSKAEKEELAKLLEKTKEELSKSENEEAIEKAMERFSKKLDNMSKEMEKLQAKEVIQKMNQDLTKDLQKKMQEKAKSDLDALTESLSKNETTKDLAKSLGNGESEDPEEALQEELDDKDIEEALEALSEQLENMSEAEKAALANTLAQAANRVSSSQLSAQLSSVSSSIASGTFNYQNLHSSLSSLKKAANSNSASGSEANSQGSGASNENNQGNSSSSGNGQGNGNGNSNNGSGNGGSNTSGQGNGNGTGGGWNMGSKQGHEEDSSGQSGEIPQDNTLGYDTNLTGEVGENSNMESSEIAYGINIAGEKVDYHSVVGDYTDKALKNVEGASIPEDMKDTIKDYFEAINQ